MGTAETLYRAPESRFVATFVGRASTLRGFVDEVSGGGDEVWVALGQTQDVAVSWSGIAAGGLEVGQRVELVVKPESLKLGTSETGGALPARAVEHRFTGPLTYCIARLLGGEEIEVLADERLPAIHEEVFVAPRESGSKPRIFALEDDE